MRFILRLLLGASLWSLLAAAGGGKCGEPASVTPTPSLETMATKPVKLQGPVADNSRCFVCHGNYDFDEEKLMFTHAKANIGCVRCHGQSSPHSTDEDGLTPPDRMYPLAHIRFNCLGCHDASKLVESDKTKKDRADLKEKPDHQSVLDGTAREKKFCTDCHGEHRLGHRTRRWDKRTSKLIYRDNTPRMLGEESSAASPEATRAAAPGPAGTGIDGGAGSSDLPNAGSAAAQR